MNWLPDHSRDQEQKRGKASANRQKPAATRPVPAMRTSHGPNASELMPMISAAKAMGWAGRSIALPLRAKPARNKLTSQQPRERRTTSRD